MLYTKSSLNNDMHKIIILCIMFHNYIQIQQGNIFFLHYSHPSEIIKTKCLCTIIRVKGAFMFNQCNVK